MPRTCRFFLFSVCILYAPIATEANSPSFQNGGLLSRTDVALLTPWSADDVAWSSSIEGYGQSSPITWEGQLYVTSVSGPNKDSYHVTAFRLHDGLKLWQYDMLNASPTQNNGYVSRAAPTPTADNEGLICFFEGGNLLALTHDGKIRWQRNLVAEYGPIESRHGLGASVEQNETHAYIWIERDNNPYVLAVQKKDGKNKWMVDGLEGTSWSSPRLIEAGKESHLVLSGSGRLCGLHPDSGENLWSFGDISGNTVVTPVPVSNGKLLIGASAGRGKDTSGHTNSNGLVAIRSDPTHGFSVDFVWRAEHATSSFASPIAHNGTAYFINRAGVVFALDLETGEEIFSERIRNSCWATPIATGEHIFLFGKKGTATILKSGPEFSQLMVNASWQDAIPHQTQQESTNVVYAAIADGRWLVLRTGSSLTCIASKDIPEK